MSAISGATVGIALGIDLAIGIASLLLFSILRICKPTNRYYDPRTYYGASSTRRAAADTSTAAHTSPPHPTSALSNTTNSAAAESADADTADADTADADSPSHAAGRTPSLLFPSPSPLAPPGESGMPLPGAPLPPALPKGLMTWVVPLLRLPEARVIAAVGLDVAMLLRFIRFALKLLLVLMVWCIGVVLPVNYTGTNLHDLQLAQLQAALNSSQQQQQATPAAANAAAATPPGFFGSLFPTIPNINSSLLRPGVSSSNSSSSSGNAVGQQGVGGAPKVQLGPGQDLGSLAQQIEQGRVGASDLDVLSMANIPAGSPLLWVHLASVYVVTVITLKLLWSATSDALKLYLAHLSSNSSNLDSASHTALLTDIPGMPRGTLIDKVLHTPFFRLLPAAVRRRLNATWTQFFAVGRAKGKAAAAKGSRGRNTAGKSNTASSKGRSREQTSVYESEQAGDAADVNGRGRWVRRRKGNQAAAAAAGAGLGAGAMAEGVESDSDVSSSRNALASQQDAAAAVRQHQQQQQQHSAMSTSMNVGVGQQQEQEASSNSSLLPGCHAINIPPETAAAAAAADSPAAFVDSSTADYDQPAARRQQQQQVRGSLNQHRPAAAALPADNSSNGHNALLATHSDQQQQHQQQQDNALNSSSSSSSSSSSGRKLALGSSSALGAALRAQQAQGVAAGVGGVGVFSDEWRRAAQALGRGMSLEDFVLREFQEVYGAHNVVAVHIVSYSPHIAKLVQQYNNTRLALEDTLDNYNQQLHAAAAAAGRRRKRSAVAAALAAPLVAIGKCCGRQSQLQQQQRAVLKPINLRTLPLPKQPKGDKHAKQSVAAAAAGNCNDSSTAAAPSPAGSAAAAGSDGGSDVARMSSSSSSSSSTRLPGQRSDQQELQLDTQQHQEQRQQQQQQQQQRDTGVASASANGLLLPVVALHAQPPTGKLQSSSNVKAVSRNNGAAHLKDAPSSISSSSSSSAKQHGEDSSSSSSSSSRGCCGRQQQGSRRGDACDVLLLRLQGLQQQLAAAHSEAQGHPLPAAFVTFRTRTALTAAVSSHHVAEAGVWKLTAAPPPDSLNWGKLGLRYWEVGLRRGAVYSVLVLLAFFYVVPVAVVQGLLQLERLQALPVIGVLVSLPGVRSLLLGVLPGLALRIFVLLLPVILYALNRRAGPVGAAQLDGWVATHFFGMQVIIVFFASFVTGSLFNQINVLFTQGLAPVLDRLGTGAPQTANFFILYIIFTAFIGRSWALLRPWGLLMSSIRALAARNRGRSSRRRALLVGTYRMFGPSVPEHSMILLLALVLSVIAPLVLCAGFVFFCMAIVVESYNWVWVFRRPYEGGGRLWKQLFRHVFIALYVFQLIMGALLIVKRFVWVTLLVPLIFCTALVQHIGSKLLQRSWDVLSVRAAHDLDVQDRQEAVQALKFWQQPQLAGLFAGTGAHAGSVQAELSQVQQSAGQTEARATGSNGFLVGDADLDSGAADAATAADADAADEVCRSQAVQWAQLYRPPAQQLLEVAGELQEQLAVRVAAMQARLAAHNAAAAAEAGLKSEARQAVEHV